MRASSPRSKAAVSSSESDDRMPFEGDVHLFVPMAPWRLMIGLRGGALFRTSVTAFWEDGAQPNPEALLAEGEPLSLTIAPASGMSLAVPRARVTSIRRSPVGLEVSLSFERLRDDDWEQLRPV